jgi:macrolide transport system ATP-binding/permease protein
MVLSDLIQDLRFGARLLMRAPGFTLAAVLCLALGIGVTTVLLSIGQRLARGELPATTKPGELARLQTPMPYGNYEELRRQKELFTDLAAFQGPVPFAIEWPDGERERIWGHLTTPNYFSVLGARPREGRLFGVEEEKEGSAQGVVISDRLWQRRFGGDRSAVGKAIRLNGQQVLVIGVAAEKFLGASPMTAAADMWLPTTASPRTAPELIGLRERRTASFQLIGRLLPGRSFDQVEAALEPLALRLEQIHNDPGKDRKERRVRLLPGGRLWPIRDEDLPAAMGFPLLLAALVLLMACGNVANMPIARGAARRREIGVRLAIGAGRGRLLRQLLTESLLLSILGGGAGLLLARYLMSRYESMSRLLPAYIHMEWSFDWRPLAYAALASLGSMLLFGLAPAWQATGDDIALALKPAAGSKLRARRWFSLRNLVVGHQVMASVVLLLLCSFIVVGYRRASSFDLGFASRNLCLLNVDPVRDGYSAEQTAAYFEKLPQWLEQVHGVTAVSLAETLPVAFRGGESIASAKVEMAGGPRSLSTLRSDWVGAGFFEAAGIEVRRGRGFTARDQNDKARVVVVNQTMAEQAWPGADPLGQTVDFAGRPYEVIGVAQDIRPALPMEPRQPAVYLPVTPSSLATPSMQGVTLVVRVQPGFDAATQLRREVAAFDPNVTVFNDRRIEDVIGQELSLVTMVTWVYGGVGAFALILASVGLAGVTAYSVARRTREIGIRMVLGARGDDVLRLILQEAVSIVVVSAVVGLGLALAAMRALSSILTAMAEATETSASDPALLIGVPVFLLALTLFACYFPARSATRINPASTLRAE